jgi:TonB dependent receptor/Transposase
MKGLVGRWWLKYSPNFKTQAVKRMKAGEKISALSRELGVSRKFLYQWRNQGWGRDNDEGRCQSARAGGGRSSEPSPIFNGSFQFQGQETGSDLADFLIGTPFFYNEQDSQSYYIRHRYQEAYLQDSWCLRPNLTVNYGVRYDHVESWSEKYNQIPTYLVGEQSVVYPNAMLGLVYPGVPNTLVPPKNRFSPRAGLAWSPGDMPGFINKITGGAGKTSVRGQRHGDRRATASLRPKLYQSGAAPLRSAVRGGGGWHIPRQSLSVRVSSIERVSQSSQYRPAIWAVYSAKRPDIAGTI